MVFRKMHGSLRNRQPKDVMHIEDVKFNLIQKFNYQGCLITYNLTQKSEDDGKDTFQNLLRDRKFSLEANVY